jgi:putative phosphoribosyl transferase
MHYSDRAEAGRILAQELEHLKGARPAVLALVRGGVPVGFEIALALQAPLDVLLVRKIGVPWQPELAVGAIVDGERLERIIDAEMVRALGVPDDYLEDEVANQASEIERRRALYQRGRAPIAVAGRAAIVVDDGIATGASMKAALRAVRRRQPARLVLAAPVAPADTIEILRAEVDEVACPATPNLFGAISQFYGDFHQVSDEEVVAFLDRAAAAAGRAGP